MTSESEFYSRIPMWLPKGADPTRVIMPDGQSLAQLRKEQPLQFTTMSGSQHDIIYYKTPRVKIRPTAQSSRTEEITQNIPPPEPEQQVLTEEERNAKQVIEAISRELLRQEIAIPLAMDDLHFSSDTDRTIWFAGKTPDGESTVLQNINDVYKYISEGGSKNIGVSLNLEEARRNEFSTKSLRQNTHIVNDLVDSLIRDYISDNLKIKQKAQARTYKPYVQVVNNKLTVHVFSSENAPQIQEVAEPSPKTPEKTIEDTLAQYILPDILKDMRSTAGPGKLNLPQDTPFIVSPEVNNLGFTSGESIPSIWYETIQESPSGVKRTPLKNSQDLDTALRLGENIRLVLNPDLITHFSRARLATDQGILDLVSHDLANYIADTKTRDKILQRKYQVGFTEKGDYQFKASSKKPAEITQAQPDTELTQGIRNSTSITKELIHQISSLGIKDLPAHYEVAYSAMSTYPENVTGSPLVWYETEINGQRTFLNDSSELAQAVKNNRPIKLNISRERTRSLSNSGLDTNADQADKLVQEIAQGLTRYLPQSNRRNRALALNRKYSLSINPNNDISLTSEATADIDSLSLTNEQALDTLFKPLPPTWARYNQGIDIVGKDGQTTHYELVAYEGQTAILTIEEYPATAALTARPLGMLGLEKDSSPSGIKLLDSVGDVTLSDEVKNIRPQILKALYKDWLIKLYQTSRKPYIDIVLSNGQRFFYEVNSTGEINIREYGNTKSFKRLSYEEFLQKYQDLLQQENYYQAGNLLVSSPTREYNSLEDQSIKLPIEAIKPQKPPRLFGKIRKLTEQEAQEVARRLKETSQSWVTGIPKGMKKNLRTINKGLTTFERFLLNQVDKRINRKPTPATNPPRENLRTKIRRTISRLDTPAHNVADNLASTLPQISYQEDKPAQEEISTRPPQVQVAQKEELPKPADLPPPVEESDPSKLADLNSFSLLTTITEEIARHSGKDYLEGLGWITISDESSKAPVPANLELRRHVWLQNPVSPTSSDEPETWTAINNYDELRSLVIEKIGQSGTRELKVEGSKVYNPQGREVDPLDFIEIYLPRLSFHFDHQTAMNLNPDYLKQNPQLVNTIAQELPLYLSPEDRDKLKSANFTIA